MGLRLPTISTRVKGLYFLIIKATKYYCKLTIFLYFILSWLISDFPTKYLSSSGIFSHFVDLLSIAEFHLGLHLFIPWFIAIIVYNFFLEVVSIKKANWRSFISFGLRKNKRFNLRTYCQKRFELKIQVKSELYRKSIIFYLVFGMFDGSQILRYINLPNLAKKTSLFSF